MSKHTLSGRMLMTVSKGKLSETADHLLCVQGPKGLLLRQACKHGGPECHVDTCTHRNVECKKPGKHRMACSFAAAETNLS